MKILAPLGLLAAFLLGTAYGMAPVPLGWPATIVLVVSAVLVLGTLAAAYLRRG